MNFLMASRSSSRHVLSHPPPFTAFFRFLSTKRPFQILGVQQIAIGCETAEPLHRLWYDVLGLSKQSSHRLESENVEEDIVQLGPPPYAVEIDLMTPIDPSKSPKVHVPPLNHIGLWVDNLEGCVAYLRQEGVRLAGGIRTGAAGYPVAFIHPKGGGGDGGGNAIPPLGGSGVLIELVQAPPHVIRALATKPLDDF